MIKLNFIRGDLIADGTSFKGYKATETIIETILRFLYSRRDLSPDTDHSLLSGVMICLSTKLRFYVGRIGHFENIYVPKN